MKKFLLIPLIIIGIGFFICAETAMALPGNHHAQSLKVDKEVLDTTKGEMMTIDYETLTSTKTTSMSFTIYDALDRVILKPIDNEPILKGVRSYQYVWDGKTNEGIFFNGKAVIEVSVFDGGYTHIKAIFVDVIGETTNCVGFSDIKENDAQCNAIRFMKETGVMKGDKGKNTFRPSDALNRAEAAKIIAETFLQKASSEPDPNSDLGHRDIEPGAWYVPYIAIAKQHGVLKGDPSGTMRPADNVNRAEFAVMFFRAAKKDISSFKEANIFSDVSEYSWYKSEANAAKNYDLLDLEYEFEGSQAMTRGEVAEWIYRFNEKALWEGEGHI